MNNYSKLLPEVKLRFRIEHPTFEECYAYGYDCACAEINEEENPFAIGSKEYEQWSDGWWAGFYGEKPLFYCTGPKDTLEETSAANDHSFFQDHPVLEKILEIAGVIAISALISYQVIDLVA